MLQIIIFQTISGWQIIYQLTYTTWGFHWWANWTLSLPVYLHSITHWAARHCHCLMLLKPRLATKQHTRQNSHFCSGVATVHIVIFRKRECAAYRLSINLSLSTVMEQKFSLQKTFRLAVPLPSTASQETLRFKAFKTVLANGQGIFRWNAEVCLSILIHFKFIKTPKTRMKLTQPDHCTDT